MSNAPSDAAFDAVKNLIGLIVDAPSCKARLGELQRVWPVINV